MEKQEVQEKYMEFQFVQQQMAEIQKQAQVVTQQAAELEASKQSLDELSKIEPGAEILVPVQNGIFMKAKLADSKELRVNVGSGITVEKTIQATKELLDNQLVELIEYRQQLVEELQMLLAQAKKLENEIVGEVG